SASPRPTVVVVLPSPSGVGVMAEMTTYFALGRSASSAIASSLSLATSCPYGSSRWGPMPILAAMSGIGMSFALRAISRSVGNSTFMPPPSYLSKCRAAAGARQHLAAPSLGRFDLVEREHVQARDAKLRLGHDRRHRLDESTRLVTARAKHPRDPAGMAAKEPGRVGDADLRRQPQEPGRVGDAGHADVDRQLDATPADPVDPGRDGGR